MVGATTSSPTCFLTPTAHARPPPAHRGQRGASRGAEEMGPRTLVWEVQSGLPSPWDPGASLSGRVEGKPVTWQTCHPIFLEEASGGE